MSRKRRLGWAKWLVALVVLGGAFAGWRWYQKSHKDPPLDFKTATVTRGDVTQAVTANGQLSALKSVTVGSQVSGIITDLKVDFNSRVTNGQVIAQIDPSTYQQVITQTDAELANAMAGLELADLNLRRARALHTNDLISASEYDQTLVAFHQAEAVVKMRQALLKKANVDLERTTIYSPIDGVVISRVVDVGQTVAASFNAPTLFNIANDLRNMRIEAMVSEADVGGVEEGQSVSFTVEAFPSRQFRGEVTQVRFAPITNQNVVTYIAVIGVNNEGLKLRPGMTANASIVTGERRNVLRIPNAALRFRPPEEALVKEATNTPAGPGGTNRPALAGGLAAAGEGASSRREEMRRRFEGMSPEQREQMRERMRARFADGGPGAGGGFGREARAGQEGIMTRTIYVLEKGAPDARGPNAAGIGSLLALVNGKSRENSRLKPVMIKTGISDGSFTEVLEGLNEGDTIVTGVNLPAPAVSSVRPPGSPFGGPFGGGMRPR